MESWPGSYNEPGRTSIQARAERGAGCPWPCSRARHRREAKAPEEPEVMPRKVPHPISRTTATLEGLLPKRYRLLCDGYRRHPRGAARRCRGRWRGAAGDAVVVAPPFTVEQVHIDAIAPALNAALDAVESRLRG